jgi:hypothetical protein
MTDNLRSAGFQGSETSSAEVTIYTNGDEFGLNQPKSGKIELKGRGATTGVGIGVNEDPSLISVMTQKSVAGPAGTFQFVVKAPRSLNFREWVSDDDWVDIVLSRHNRKFHTMRGLVDDVRRSTSVQNGATTRDWVISGRDWQKVFEDTIVWFNRFAGENVWGGAALQAFLAQENLFAGANVDFEAGSVPANVAGFLCSMLESLGEFGRSTWELPDSLPGVFSDDTFINALRFNFAGFTNEPRRIASRPMFHSFQGVSEQNLWSLAQEWSDPPFCEFYTELLLDNGEKFPGPDDETGSDLNGNVMTVVLRDRPFATETPPWGSISEGPWWDLPLFQLARQEVVTDDIGRTGRERKNTFVFQPAITQELMGQSVQVSRPLWDERSVRKHGTRLHYVLSKYTALGTEASGVINLADAQRLRLRDWHCLNHLFYNGSIQIPRGAPSIKVGSRVRVVDEQGPDFDETYYCESVAHNWALKPGLRTSLGVTRGVIGTENAYRKLLNDCRALYKLSDGPVRPDAEGGEDP